MKKYSFVVPTYQNKTILKNTLEALNRQRQNKPADYEVIVVDDGSTDNTFEYINNVNRKYELKYIYLERKENSSRSMARNCGWKEAEGEVIIFIDSDIIVKENYLDELDRYFAENDDILVLGLRIMLPESITYENIYNGSIFEKYSFNAKNHEMLEIRHFVFSRFSYNLSSYKYPWLFVFTCNAAVPKRLLQKIGGFDENFLGWGVEDNELGYRLAKEGTKIICGSKLEVFHQFHKNNMEESLLDNNIRYFLEKHPDALNDISMEDKFNIFKGKARINMSVDDTPGTRTEIIEYKDRNRLEEVKNSIINLSGNKGINLVINDYIEDADLGFWVHMLGKRNSTPKLFIVSKLAFSS